MMKPQYSFAEGIRYTVDTFNGAPTSTRADGSIGIDDIHAIEAQLTNNNLTYVQHRKEIDESDFVTVAVPNSTGRKRQEVQFEYSLVNPGADSDAVTAITLGWGTNYRRPGTARGIAALAMALGTPCVVMNPLGQGRSSNVPRAVAVSDLRNGSYIGQGGLYARALESLDILRGDRRRIGIGESRGMRLKIGALASGEYREDIGVYCDGTGFPALGFNGLRRAMKAERRHGQEYGKAHQDPTDREIQPEIQAYGNDARFWQQLRSGRLYQHIGRDVRLLGKPGMSDFTQAMGNIRERAIIVTLECSELTDSQQMLEHCADMAPKVSATMEHVTVRGLTHFFGGSAGARTSVLTRPLAALDAGRPS